MYLYTCIILKVIICIYDCEDNFYCLVEFTFIKRNREPQMVVVDEMCSIKQLQDIKRQLRNPYLKSDQERKAILQ